LYIHVSVYMSRCVYLGVYIIHTSLSLSLYLCLYDSTPQLQDGYAECLLLLRQWSEARGGAGSEAVQADVSEAQKEVLSVPSLFT
jgi:hypothetical protein